MIVPEPTQVASRVPISTGRGSLRPAKMKSSPVLTCRARLNQAPTSTITTR
jgi:hypothetical protein